MTEMRQPTKTLIPLPQGGIVLKNKLRGDIQDRASQIAFPPTTAAGFGAGRSSAPLTDWKPQLPQADARARAGDSVRQRVG